MNIISSSRKPQHPSRHHQAAFTIVELLIVIVVIAILAALSFVAYVNISQRATDSAIAHKETQAKRRLEAYKVDNNSYPPDQATFDEITGQKPTDKFYTTYTSASPHDSYTMETGGGSPNPANTVTLPWTSDGYNGLINYLGTDGGTVSFSNPHPSKITASQSSDQDGQRLAYRGIDHLIFADSNESHTSRANNSWWKLDLGVGKSIKLERFGILGRSSMERHPRSFKIQGSNDDSAWTDLLTVSGDGPDNGTWWSGQVGNSSTYRYIRVLQTGGHSTFHDDHLVLGDVELWGVYYK